MCGCVCQLLLNQHDDDDDDDWQGKNATRRVLGLLMRSKNTFAVGAQPRIPLGELQRSPDPLTGGEGLAVPFGLEFRPSVPQQCPLRDELKPIKRIKPVIQFNLHVSQPFKHICTK